MQQGSPEWLQARCGKVTASRIGDLLAKTKTGWGASRANYKAELVAERLTGTPYPQFQSPAMRWGTETEPQARAAYEFTHDVEIHPEGFVEHPTIAMSGASPDGSVLDGIGLVEFKCPNTATHLATLKGGAIDQSYLYQMFWQMDCTGAQWTDFCSFDPRLPHGMRLHVQRVRRPDDAAMLILRNEVGVFLDEVAKEVADLNRIYGLKEAA